MSTIIPSILPKTRKDLLEQIKTVGFAKRAQIDLMDNKFVPNITPTPEQLPKLNPKIYYEAHLMMFDGETHLLALKKAGVKTVIFSYESYKTEDDIHTVLGLAKGMGFVPGLAINPETRISRLKPFLKEAGHILLMSVHPGFDGKPFIEKTYSRVKELVKLKKATKTKFLIEIDGGVKEGMAKKLKDVGVDLIIVGSGIRHTDNPKKAYNEFCKEIK